MINSQFINKLVSQMTTGLYGGAITIKQLPASFIDVSHIRDVPDTQEVFINETSTTSGKLDHSLIIDLLEKSIQLNIKKLFIYIYKILFLIMYITNLWKKSTKMEFQDISVMSHSNQSIRKLNQILQSK